jgi:hypothetical protein
MKTLLASIAISFALLTCTLNGATPQSSNAASTVVQRSEVDFQSPQGNPDVVVWVNTKSGVYHCPGSRWYGDTKQGEYMKQRQAQEKGYRPAYGKVCQ